MTKPDDVTQEAWDRAINWADIYVADEKMDIETVIARAIMAAEKRGEERVLEGCLKVLGSEIENAKIFGPHFIPLIIGIRAKITKSGEAK